jgi:Peptidase M15
MEADMPNAPAASSEPSAEPDRRGIDTGEHDSAPTMAMWGLRVQGAIPGLRGRVRAGLITPHFHEKEFNCHDGTPFPRASLPELKRHCELILEPMRARFGRCTVVSGYRHPTYNRGVGGEKGSIHQWGHAESAGSEAVATDLKFARGTPAEWASYARELRTRQYGGKGGLGDYPTFVHVDSRDWTADW